MMDTNIAPLLGSLAGLSLVIVVTGMFIDATLRRIATALEAIAPDNYAGEEEDHQQPLKEN